MTAIEYAQLIERKKVEDDGRFYNSNNMFDSTVDDSVASQ